MYVVFSLLVHGGLIWLLLNFSAPEEEQPQEVEIEFTESKGPASLRKLVPQLKMPGDFKTELDAEGTGGLQDSAAVYDPHSSWGAGSGNVQLIEQFIALDRLREQTNGATHYPRVLAYHNITGNCNARVVIDRDGCDWRRTRIWASERHLRVYVLSVLKKICGTEDVKRLGIQRPINVDFAFSFLQSEREMPAHFSALRGNVIIVQRWSHRSIAEWRVGPFKGIFPIPAVSLDFTWLQENWEQYVNEKNPFYEFDRDYKDMK